MDSAELRSRFTSSTVEAAWSAWAELGLSAAPSNRSPFAADPEALILFTLNVARFDPRLFDELLDWLVLNGERVSMRRLARLARTDIDHRLIAGAIGWVGEQGGSLRAPLAAGSATLGTPSLLFPGLAPPERHDPVFERAGLLRAPATRSRKSLAPDTRRPAAFAFRLRGLFGVGTRADIVRFLLTSGVPRATAAAIADDAAATKRNVALALSGLADAGVVDRVQSGNTAWFGLDRARWAQFLGTTPDELPAYRDWPRRLAAATVVLDWLHEPGLDDLDGYLRASEARRMLEPLRHELLHAGIALPAARPAAEYWETLVESADMLLAGLAT